MKALWKKFAAAIDGRNTRERVLILAAATAVTFMLMETLLVGPVYTARKRLIAETRNDQAEIGKLAGQVRTLTLARAADPNRALKSRLAELKDQETTLRSQIDSQAADLVSPDRMPAVLERILVNNARLQLIEIKTLPRVGIGAGKPQGAARQPSTQPGGAAPVEEQPEMYRHGVEISMRGSYLDLLAYLKKIESLPVRLFWDSVNLSAAAYPAVTMRLVVYTVSLEKVWLTV